MACELAGKAVLIDTGATINEVKRLGHNLISIHSAISSLFPSPIEDTVSTVVRKMPKYVDVRYESPRMTILDAQDIFRKGMFLIAESLRRTNHDQGYWTKVSDGTMPSRIF